ncbi:hypothetical protein WAI453_006285 [Rhynchosporium graminicola]|uniref:Protein kinase domain-containing protein n=1 Tax=Rhynchosporium graminicola TaxID=2792576 RepID=A0A1E1L6X5_9HELO|nr:uncharacterized protein RCO7_03301 [Rhynchosporium commune]
MAEVLSHDQKTWVISERWNNRSAECLEVSAFDGFSAYIGNLPLTEKSNFSLGSYPNSSKFDRIFKDLRRLPEQHLYPAYQNKFTQFDTTTVDMWSDGEYYFKAPSISEYNDDDAIAKLTLEEVDTNEVLKNHPHPNLGVYLGCIVHKGLIVRLAFRKYFNVLPDRVWVPNSTIDFPAEARIKCMDGIAAAAKHLHLLGYAHNDISPSNIMFDGNDVPILIDLDSCGRFGSKIRKGGAVNRWRSSVQDGGMTFEVADVEFDELAIEYLRKWLMEDSTNR